MGVLASQITSLTIVYLNVYLGADQRKHQSAASLAFVRGIHRSPVSNAENVSIWWRHHGLLVRRDRHNPCCPWAPRTYLSPIMSAFYSSYCYKVIDILVVIIHWLIVVSKMQYGKVQLIEAEWRIHPSLKWVTIGSDNGLSPVLRQAIIWTNAGILLIGPLGTNFSEILFGIQTFSFKKLRLKTSSAKMASILSPPQWVKVFIGTYLVKLVTF